MNDTAENPGDESHIKSIIFKWLRWTAGVLFVAWVGFQFNSCQTAKDSEIRELVYAVRKTPNFITQEQAKIGMIRDGESIDAVSAAQLLVFNNTDKNFEDLTLTVELELESEKSFDLISAEANGFGKRFDYEVIEDAPWKHTYSYTFPSVNKKDTSFLTIDYRFVGNEVPNIKAILQTSGAELKEISPDTLIDKSEDGEIPYRLMFFLMAFAGVLVSIRYCFSVIALSKSKEKNEALESKIRDVHIRQFESDMEIFMSNAMKHSKTDAASGAVAGAKEPSD